MIYVVFLNSGILEGLGLNPKPHYQAKASPRFLNCRAVSWVQRSTTKPQQFPTLKLQNPTFFVEI